MKQGTGLLFFAKSQRYDMESGDNLTLYLSCNRKKEYLSCNRRRNWRAAPGQWFQICDFHRSSTAGSMLYCLVGSVLPASSSLIFRSNTPNGKAPIISSPSTILPLSDLPIRNVGVPDTPISLALLTA